MEFLEFINFTEHNFHGVYGVQKHGVLCSSKMCFFTDLKCCELIFMESDAVLCAVRCFFYG